ncbi:MAG: hypothetical protein K2H17_07430 [Duncaniella sp.]|uniref:hypothetical protein n=1 Tax=Duncaniella sp. TaxID=2518496 RepID=UPI0023D5905A|nr:hypothetical protein [Duncaniella sp.]MDE5989213.1 hypothetical protein [Duncaniella sp.]
MSDRIRGIFPGLRGCKPQYVLGTNDGNERTSNVTEEKIRDAIDDIEDNGCVYLEKCVPVVLVRYAEAYSIDYYKDGSIAVCFRVNGYLLRMWRSDIDCDVAADMMCDFFRNASLPDMTAWHCQKIYPEQEEAKERLCVDGEDFRYFGCQDVVGALENIIEGKSLWMLYDFTKGDVGYVNIRRRDNDAAPTAVYKVEYVRWTEPAPIGFRGVVSDAGLLRSWLWSLIEGERLPDPLSCWEEFDVNDHFGRLVFRFLDNDKNQE